MTLTLVAVPNEPVAWISGMESLCRQSQVFGCDAGGGLVWDTYGLIEGLLWHRSPQICDYIVICARGTATITEEFNRGVPLELQRYDGQGRECLERVANFLVFTAEAGLLWLFELLPDVNQEQVLKCHGAAMPAHGPIGTTTAPSSSGVHSQRINDGPHGSKGRELNVSMHPASEARVRWWY